MGEEAGIKPRLFDFWQKNRGEPKPSPIIFLIFPPVALPGQTPDLLPGGGL
jgi:hypothetical protein